MFNTKSVNDIIEAVISIIMLFAIIPVLNQSISDVSAAIGSFGTLFGLMVYSSLGLALIGIVTLRNRLNLASIIGLVIVMAVMSVAFSTVTKYVNGVDLNGDGVYNGTGEIEPVLNSLDGPGADILKIIINLFFGSGLGYVLMTFVILRRLGFSIEDIEI